MANLFAQGQNVDFTNPENGKTLPCFVLDVTPVANAAGTVTSYNYTISGDLNDVDFPVGEAYGPFKQVAETSLTNRTGLAS